MSSSPAPQPTNQPDSPDLRKKKVERLFEDLHQAQRELGFFSLEKLEQIAKDKGLHRSELHAIVSYYPHFYLEKQPEIKVRVCDDMSCHLRGSTAIHCSLKKEFERVLNDVTQKKMILEKVSCLGRCDQAPVFEINQCYYDGFTPDDAKTEVQKVLGGDAPETKSYAPASAKAMLEPSVKLHNDPYDGKGSYSALRYYAQKNSNSWETLLSELEAAKLRGMGGAGYPTHLKWRKVRASRSPEKYVICNADESEPGTIKDRFILTSLPHLVIEGTILAGLCVGAKQGYIYIRHEYHDQIDTLNEELQFCRDEKLIGNNVLGTGIEFNLDLIVSPGGYICGEETALLEAIEGRRAEPRNKPPYLADVGLWQQPTIVNNVETLAFAAGIAHRCSGWFTEWFTEWDDKRYVGRKFVGISGDVRKPGVYEVPLGITYHELIYGQQYGGGLLDDRGLIAFAPSGASSGYLPGHMADKLPMYWEPVQKADSIMGSCAVVVCGEGACMVDMTLNAVRFFRKESCGKCVPCRIGSEKLVEILDRWVKGKYRDADGKLVTELSDVLRNTSICALGQSVPVPVQSLVKHFPELIEEHAHQHCRAGVCFKGDGHE